MFCFTLLQLRVENLRTINDTLPILFIFPCFGFGKFSHLIHSDNIPNYMTSTIATLRSLTGFELILGFYRNDFSTLFKKNERKQLRSFILDKGIPSLQFTHDFRLRHYKFFRKHFHLFASYQGSHLEQPLHKIKRRKLD